jgi:hypothetical protein
LWDDPGPPPHDADARHVTSLVGYAYELLDARSGYPAGIRDPGWQERVLRALAVGPDAVDAHVAEAVVSIAKDVRRRGHVAGVPDANEAVRLARDLARLRALPAPSRRELLEGIESALARGEILGRGRILARACEEVLVGRRRGRVAPGTPRSGLGPHVETLLAELRLPLAADAAKTGPKDDDPIRLDPLRSELDRRRHAALVRLGACGIPYGALLEAHGTGGAETLTLVWKVRWQPATDAMIELAGLRGVTLRHAAAGAMRAERARAVREERLTHAARLALLGAAADAGLPDLVAEDLRDVVGAFATEAGLAELVDAIALVDRIRRGHVPALPVDAALACKDVDTLSWPADVDPSVLVAAAVRALDGITGSDRVEDARAMAALVRLFETTPDGEAGGATLGDARLGWAVDRLAREGAPLVAGAAEALRVVMGRAPAAALGDACGSWIDAALDADGRRALSLRLRGALVVAAPLLEAHGEALDALLARVEALPDADFLARVSALREGFDVLSPAARARLLAVLAERLGAADPTGRGLDVYVDEDPAVLADYAHADAAGREAMGRWPSA